MSRKLIALAVALIGIVVSACGGHMTGSNLAVPGATYVLPPVDGDLQITAVLPKRTIGEKLPAEGLGKINDEHWEAVLGGYTQQRYSQALGFRPGTKITIRNLSKSLPHTLDVVAEIKRPPALFPKNPKLSIKAHGGGILDAGYASGEIKPGKSVTVTLSKAGIYLIGCAFHYKLGMHDVLVVTTFARPGPQATPPPTTKPTTTPTTRSSYGP
jgi:plastocyanin